MATALSLCFCSGMSGPGGSAPVGGNDNPGAGLSSGSHAVGGDTGTGSNPQAVPSGQQAGESGGIIPMCCAVAFQVQVKVMSQGQVQTCQPVSPKSNLVTSSVAICNSGLIMDSGTKTLSSGTDCQNPEPSPLALPNAPKINFEFTRTGTGIDPQYATDKRTVDALCYSDGSWKAWLVFHFAGSPNPPPGQENPFSIKASASYNYDSKTFSSSPLMMPPFPSMNSDDGSIPVSLTIDLDGQPTAIAE